MCCVLISFRSVEQHRDIKSPNFLLTDGLRVKVADFGTPQVCCLVGNTDRTACLFVARSGAHQKACQIHRYGLFVDFIFLETTESEIRGQQARDKKKKIYKINPTSNAARGTLPVHHPPPALQKLLFTNFIPSHRAGVFRCYGLPRRFCRAKP